MASLEQTKSIHQAVTSVSAGQVKGLLIFVSSQHCPWCHAVIKEQLLPRLRSQSLPPISIIEFDIQDTRPLMSHQNKQDTWISLKLAWPEGLSPASWAKSLRIRAVPTIVAVNEKLQPLVEPLVGYNLADFYGSYLEDQVNASIHYWKKRRSSK
jgi:thioredoxin-related protein